METVRNRCTIDFIKKDETDKFSKQQSKLTFDGIHKTYKNCDSYTFKQNEVFLDKPIYLGVAILELSRLHMYETYYDKLQSFFGMERIQLHHMDCVSFALSLKTEKFLIDLKNLEDLFDFSNLDEYHEILFNKNKNVIGKYKIETPKNI